MLFYGVSKNLIFKAKDLFAYSQMLVSVIKFRSIDGIRFGKWTSEHNDEG